jgi:tRNA A-37 threonylcarbamoyl transferase component Bud32
MVAGMELPRFRLSGVAAPRVANATAGFLEPMSDPVFEVKVLARGNTGVMPSFALETLRRARGIAADRIAYVEGIGLLLGKQITLPVSVQGAVPLRFHALPPVSATRLGDAQVRNFLEGKIIFLDAADHVISTVAGKKLAAEAWASLVDDALAGATPRMLMNSSWLALAMGLSGSAILFLIFLFGAGSAALAGLGIGVSLLYPLAALAFYLGSGWWLPPERPFFAILGAGFLGALAALGNRRGEEIPSRPTGAYRPQKATTAALPPSHAPGTAGVPLPTARLRAGPEPHPDIERDAQGGLVRLGKYRIARKMGAGSAGDVFEGLDTQMSRRVAIKTMTRGAALHFDHALERFMVEAKAAGSLNHPNINTIYDSGSYRDVSFMVLEYLDGVTLSQWMRSHAPQPPAPPMVGEWVRQIAAALDYAHGHRVIHRDLKPSNLMVVDQGRTIKLLDFGVAKVEDVMLTQAGMTVGTPSYMSPEQLQGEKVSPASDQYSFAVVLYQLFSYRLPYHGSRIPEICGHILKNELIPLTEANPALPQGYWTMLRRALRRDPGERYPSCTALYLALESVWSAQPA